MQAFFFYKFIYTFWILDIKLLKKQICNDFDTRKKVVFQHVGDMFLNVRKNVIQTCDDIFFFNLKFLH